MVKDKLTKRTRSGTFKRVRWHRLAKEVVSVFPEQVKSEMGYLLYRLQIGEMIGMPQARSMPTISAGVYEIRVKGRDGIYRLFYVLKTDFGILAFHAFQKKTQKTELSDLKLGRQRLKELLGDLSGES